MKKSMIALAVASAATFAQADNTTLYGSVRMAYTYDSAGAAKENLKDLTKLKFDGVSKFGNSSSRFGIKGSDDLGNGLKAIYKYENRIGSGLATKKLWVGLEGGFGKVTLGKQNLPHDNLTNNTDPFNALTPGFRNLTTKDAKGEDLEQGVITDSDNSLVYTTPDMSGFSAGLGLIADGASGEKHIDGYNIVAQYDANGVYAGLGYEETGRGNDSSDTTTRLRQKTVGLGLGYSADAFSVGLLVEKTKWKTADASSLYARLAANYNISDMDSVYAGISARKDKIGGVKQKKPVAVSLGYQHKLSNRTKVWAEYGYTKSYQFNDSTGMMDKVKGNKVSLGLRTDF